MLTLLQGQKYLPFRESKLTQVLKESVGATSCRAISVLACVSSDIERYFDTTNAIQVAAKLQRIKKRSKPRMGISSKNSSGGESSDEGRRRRWPKSASDPECTSSSEQSAAETVIFLGGPQGFKRNRIQGVDSDKEQTTDAESTVIMAPTYHPRSPMAPVRNPNFSRNTKEETWIDGPHYSKPKPIWIDGPDSPRKLPSASSLPGLDPFKQEMIQRWVLGQEDPGTREIWIDGRESKAQIPQEIVIEEDVSPPGLPEPTDPTASSMNTSSELSGSKIQVEMHDFCIQVEETEIDVELGQLAMQNHYLWAQPDQDVHFLEDIQEADEENLSSGTYSLRSGEMSQYCGMPEHRNEALAIPKIILGDLADLDQLLSSGEEAGHQLNSSGDSHPLRILSREAIEIGIHSDSFSIASEQYDNLSLPGTDQLNDEELPDEELEQAMAASMSSLRSHEILEKLRSEARWQELRDQARQREEKDLFNCNWNPEPNSQSSFKPMDRPFPLESRNSYPVDGASITDMQKSEQLSRHGSKTIEKLKHLKPASLVCCSMASSSSSGKTGPPLLDSFKGEKLQKPTIPPIPVSVSREITSKLVTGNQKSASKLPKAKDSMSKSALGSKMSKVEEDKRFNTLPGSKANTSDTKLPKQGWRRRDSNSSTNSKSYSKGQLKDPKDKDKTIQKQRTKSEEKAPPSALKSPSRIMSFLKSPTGGPAKKAASSSPALRRSKRASSGYDSGHDSGIGTVGDSPEIHLMSPYSKVTNPKQSPRTSSGHGSDSSSAEKSKLIKPGKLSSFLIPGKNKPRNRESFSASSGYESAGMKEVDSDHGMGHSLLPRTSIPTASTARKLSNGSVQSMRSKSAPQTPSTVTLPSNVRMHESQLVDGKSEQNRVEKLTYRRGQHQLNSIKGRQEVLKRELESAKERLCIPNHKWSYELHVENCMDPDSSGLIEALEQETHILEKRVIACRSHVMMVTTFL